MVVARCRYVLTFQCHRQRPGGELSGEVPDSHCRLVLDRAAVGKRIPCPRQAAAGELPLMFKFLPPRAQAGQGEPGRDAVDAPAEVIRGREDANQVGQRVVPQPQVNAVPAARLLLRYVLPKGREPGAVLRVQKTFFVQQAG
jgi:hypothetical protein